jgi:hypothetical protein
VSRKNASGRLLAPCRAPLRSLSEFPDSLSRHFGEKSFSRCADFSCLGHHAWLTKAFGFASHVDDDFSFDASFSKMPERFRNLAQRVRPVDDRDDFAGFIKLRYINHIP